MDPASTGGSAEEPDDRTPLLPKRPRTYKVICEDGVALRDEAGRKAKCNGGVLKCGEVFDVSDVVTVDQDGGIHHWQNRQATDSCYLCLCDGRGWVMDRDIGPTREFHVTRIEDTKGCETLRARLRGLFFDETFEHGIMLVILINAITIGLEISSPDALHFSSWLVVNSLFAVFYLTEMALKFFAIGMNDFFKSNWNVFDAVVTITTFAGDCLTAYQFLLHGTHDDAGLTAVVPVLRLLRILRAANLFVQLRMLVHAFMGSVGSLSWIAMFTLLWFYICACLCTVFLGRPAWLGQVAHAEAYSKRFENIGMSMYTLFEVMTLEGWIDVVRPLVRHRPILVAFFLFFAFITAFFLLNLVTGVVVDRTMEAKKETDESEDVEQAKRQYLFVKLYNELLALNGGRDNVRRDDLRAWADIFDVKDITQQLELEETLEHMWYLVDHNAAGEVSLKELYGIWQADSQPLDREFFLRGQVQTARRIDELLQRLDMLEASRPVTGPKA